MGEVSEAKPFFQNNKKNQFFTLYSRVDPKNPKRLSISDKLSFGPRSEAEKKRLNFWNKVWEEFPPGVHEHSTKTYQETAKKYFKGKGEASTNKQEL